MSEIIKGEVYKVKVPGSGVMYEEDVTRAYAWKLFADLKSLKSSEHSFSQCLDIVKNYQLARNVLNEYEKEVTRDITKNLDSILNGLDKHE